MADIFAPESGWYGSGNGGYAYFRFKLTPTYNISTNKTSLAIGLQVKFTGNATWMWPYMFSQGVISVNGSSALTLDYTYSVSNPTAKDTWYNVLKNGSATLLTREITHAADGKASVTVGLSGVQMNYAYGSSNYYISLTGSYSETVSLNQTRTFKLTISAGTGSTITVTRGGSALTNGATVTYGDVLTISFAAKTGYTLGAHTVNGATFTSGNTHTVTGAVSVESTATAKTYTLTISQDAHSTATVKRNGVTLSNNATISTGDVLVITFAAASGYKLKTHTVNGSAFTSGGSWTVSGAVAVAVTSESGETPATADGGVWLYVGGTWPEYQAYIFAGGAWYKYQPYIYTSNGWVKY